MIAAALVAAVVALPQVLAHGGVLSYNIAGTNYQGFSPYNSASGQTWADSCCLRFTGYSCPRHQHDPAPVAELQPYPGCHVRLHCLQ
jgi:hypothetical protein